jgi:hypothetical protein
VVPRRAAGQAPACAGTGESWCRYLRGALESALFWFCYQYRIGTYDPQVSGSSFGCADYSSVRMEVCLGRMAPLRHPRQGSRGHDLAACSSLFLYELPLRSV